jgi:hypothetical protein
VDILVSGSAAGELAVSYVQGTWRRGAAILSAADDLAARRGDLRKGDDEAVSCAVDGLVASCLRGALPHSRQDQKQKISMTKYSPPVDILAVRLVRAMGVRTIVDKVAALRNDGWCKARDCPGRASCPTRLPQQRRTRRTVGL